ncbi:MAG: hypothetical protein M3400_14225 [Actinomycetota bacterium]|nr:hypothetical protein [Actinomycetota bacterium]
MILRVLAGTFLLVFAAACALVEVLYLPLRAGLIPIPLSVVSAAVLNIIFTRAMYILTGSVIAALLPGAAWLAVVARSATARPEGDLLLTNGDTSTGLLVVNISFLVLGALGLAFAVATLRRHFPPDRAKPRLGPSGRHSHRRWRLPQREPRQGSHAAARHRPSSRSVVARQTEVSQPPETAGIT